MLQLKSKDRSSQNQYLLKCFLLCFSELTDYCATERFDVTCKPGHVILMTSAQYGRMRSGRCIGGVALGCQTDVLGYMDSKCSGKQKCSLGVNDIDLHATPCPKDYKSYLEASYTCVPGKTV